MRALTVIALFVLALVALVRPAIGEAPPSYVVIVHPHNANDRLARGFIADAFLKKTTRWPNGSVIRPVDLPPDAPARDRFSRDVLKRSVSAVRSYWQQMVFSGRDLPPPELATDVEVVRYVAKNPTAIGYVSGPTVAQDVKVVTVE